MVQLENQDLSLSGSSRRAGTDHDNFQLCPQCGDDRWHFYINRNTGAWDCKKCGAAGVSAEYGGSIDELFCVGRPYEWKPIDPPDTEPISARVLVYLEGRSVPASIARGLGLRFLPPDRVFIPYYNEMGELIYWTARALGKDTEPRYKNCPGVKHPLWFAFPPIPLQVHPRMVVAVEGPFDAMAVYQVGYMAVALGGKTLAKHLERLLADLCHNRGYSIAVCLDGDALTASIALSARLRDLGIDNGIVALDFGEDPASIGIDKLRELLR
jgi:hypothetical protein